MSMSETYEINKENQTARFVFCQKLISYPFLESECT